MSLSKERTSKIAQAKARWTLKVDTLKGDPSIPGIVELSLYDSKPFYFMYNACEVFKWNKMTRKVWSKEKNINPSSIVPDRKRYPSVSYFLSGLLNI